MRRFLKLVHRWRPTLIEIDKLRATVFMTYLIQPGVAHDHEQPTFEIAVDVRTVRRACRTKISVLHQIFGFSNVVRQGKGVPVERVDVFERRLAEWALGRPDRFADPGELARQYAQTRAHRTWVPGEHELMARAVLRRDEAAGDWVLACPRELEASIYLQAMTLNLWPPAAAYGGPVKMIAADPEAPGAPAPAFANRALAEEGGYAYEAIRGTGHLLQIQKPEECRRSMLEFLEAHGLGA